MGQGNWISVKGNALLVITEECLKPEGDTEPISAWLRVRSRDNAFFLSLPPSLSSPLLSLHGFHSIVPSRKCFVQLDRNSAIHSIRNSGTSFPIELALYLAGLVEIPRGNLVRFSKSTRCETLARKEEFREGNNRE